MDDLNSIILEGTVVGAYDTGRAERFSRDRFDIINRRSSPRNGRRRADSRFTVDLSRLSDTKLLTKIRRGARLRVVGYLDRPERGQPLVVADHVEVKAIRLPVPGLVEA